MSASENNKDNVRALRPDVMHGPVDRLGPTDNGELTEQHQSTSVSGKSGICIPKGTFVDKELERIAKRLCDHMNLNINLCSQLERLADGLPDNVDRQECLYVARSIVPIVKLAHEFEEDILFPSLRENLPDEPDLENTLERLKGEHWEDESHAAEIHNGLMTYVSEPSQSNTESLGYMLRGFFEGMRRHIAFEREHILPRLKQLDVKT